VDGGVHDNQGIGGLLEQDCRTILVSDASGQMPDESRPKSRTVPVLSRTMSMLQARVRVAQHKDLSTREESGLLRTSMFIHLKRDLVAKPEGWIRSDGSREPAAGAAAAAPGDDRTPTSYGVSRTLQRLLAEIRTDLDSFTEVEAFALMTDGFLQTKAFLPPDLAAYGAPAAPRPVAWEFLRIQPLMDGGQDRPNARWELRRQLAVAKCLACKYWRGNLRGGLQEVFLKSRNGALWLAALGLLAIVLVAVWWLPVHGIVRLALAILLGLVALATVAQIHLRLVDPRFLERGTLRHLESLDRAPPAGGRPSSLA
jgi:hypothetical protein